MSKHIVLVKDIQLYVFCQKYREANARRNKSGAFEIYFVSEQGMPCLALSAHLSISSMLLFSLGCHSLSSMPSEQPGHGLTAAPRAVYLAADKFREVFMPPAADERQPAIEDEEQECIAGPSSYSQ